MIIEQRAQLLETSNYTKLFFLFFNGRHENTKYNILMKRLQSFDEAASLAHRTVCGDKIPENKHSSDYRLPACFRCS